MCFSPTPPRSFLLVASRMLTGVGSGNITAAQAYITDITPPEGRAKAMGIIGAAFGLGFIFGPPLGSFVFDHFGVEWVGYLAAAICVLNMVAVWAFLPESIKEKRDGPAKLSIKPDLRCHQGLKERASATCTSSASSSSPPSA
jgi:DHA1 family tetracycline resistance protein-like MFS transporter